MLTIWRCTAIDVETNHNFKALSEEYAAESAMVGYPSPDAKAALYKQLEAAGALTFIGAFTDDKIIGIITVLLSIIPHYGVTGAVTESFFVQKAYRHLGAGIKLLREAERLAKEGGAPGLLVSAPVGGPLAEVLPHCGYTETNRVFFKKNT